ncbi:hypothetical protein QFZ87_004471 [Bacillus sp. SLBN-46]|uniref:hypothetical protein n=1 Tax=Bacillus sp. SLBN-46 TaxID=3042283 RepID=UPI002856F99D|nr:hypothetical protein [Bacillus sp. SLBN-46]MDR6124874.1 hypothetical protein [Bacillus sp. SLBN-46]
MNKSASISCIVNYSPHIAIPHSDAKSDDCDDLIYNYSINSDPLSEAVWFGAAVRVGRDIPELDYTQDSAVDFNAI